MTAGLGVTGINHIGVTVSDMKRAVTFFRDVLGAELTAAKLNDDPKISTIVGLPGVAITICFATVGGVTFELLEYASPPGRQAQNHRPCDPGHMHICLSVSDIDAVTARMREHGFEPAGPVQSNVSGSPVSASYCYGFDGLVVELIQVHEAAVG